MSSPPYPSDKIHQSRTHILPRESIVSESRNLNLAEGGLLKVRKYDLLFSFGSGGRDSTGAAYETEINGNGFKEVMQNSEAARKAGSEPYIDAEVLPSLPGSYRLKSQANDSSKARSVLWKDYYMHMIATVNYWIFRIDRFWLESWNCFDELTWIPLFTGVRITVQFLGDDAWGKSIYERATGLPDLSP